MPERTSREDFYNAANNIEKPAVPDRPDPVRSEQVARSAPHPAPQGHVHPESVRESHATGMRTDQARSDANNGYKRETKAAEKIKELAKHFNKENQQKDPTKSIEKTKSRDRERDD